MNNQELQYNIALSIQEVDDVMASLADRANNLSNLQKKIYNQAIQQKNSFDTFMSGNNNVVDNEPTEGVAQNHIENDHTGETCSACDDESTSDEEVVF